MKEFFSKLYLWPIMIVPFACIILKEKLTVQKIIAMLMSFAGIVVLTLGNTDSGNGSRLSRTIFK